MRRPTVAQAIFGGFIGTVCLSLITYFGPWLGWPRVDYAMLFANRFTTWDLGLLAQFTLGIVVFPLFLVYFFWNVLPGPAIVKAVLWAMILWVISEAAFLPSMAGGFFSTRLPRPVLAATLLFVAHLFYGFSLGIACSELFWQAVPGVEGEEVRTSHIRKAS